MAVHRLHLHPEPFKLIAEGRKTIEVRLFDEKRKLIEVGDKLIFVNRSDEGRELTASVIGLHRADLFKDLFQTKNLRDKFSTQSIDALEEGVNRYYLESDQHKYGVVGIEFAVVADH